MKKYKVIAFDLDDTLLDTSHLLVPLASRLACSAMISEGLHCDVETCHQMRHELASQHSHPEIFAQIAQHFGCRDEKAAIEKAVQTFYSPDIPTHMPLMKGAEKNLQALQADYRLYLVTMGNPETQLKKINSMNLNAYFQDFFILDGLKGQRKETAFQEIIQREKIQPHELLSIGNRLSSEIRDGKKTGADTCYFAYGEHLGEQPQTPFDLPDFTIHRHEELISACAL